MNRINDYSKDGSEWELSKENVQPIKQGRKIPNLTVALSSNAGEDAHWKLQRDKRDFEDEIRTYDGDDPLDVWYRYILWIEENLPKGGREISTLLERCIKEFKDVAKYRCDERYMYIWLKYADCCSDPLEIYNYMYGQEISPMHTQFYIAWASACENIGSYKKADEVIVLGIERKAKPEDLLKKYHIGFQHRLTNHIASNDDSQSGETSENSRTTLGELKTSKMKNIGVMRASNIKRPVVGMNRSIGLGVSQGSLFSIHHDCDSENQPRLPGSNGSWKEPPTHSTVTKENENAPGKWTNNDKPSNRRANLSSIRPPTAKQTFQIHVEENAVQTGYTPHCTIGNQVLTARKPEKEDSHDPLKVIAQDNNENNGKPKFKVMYDKSKVYTGTEEFQFEEIRAAKYASLKKQGLPLPKDIRLLKRQQEPQKESENFKVMYQKEKVYALEGEFQPEEIMARRYYAQGKRLRLRREEVKQEEAKREEPKGEEVKREEVKRDEVKGEEVKKDEVKREKVEREEAKREEVKIFEENVNTSRRGRGDTSRRAQKVDMSVKIQTSDRPMETNDVLQEMSENVLKDDKENKHSPPSSSVMRRGALKEVTRSSHHDIPSDDMNAPSNHHDMNRPSNHHDMNRPSDHHDMNRPSDHHDMNRPSNPTKSVEKAPCLYKDRYVSSLAGPSPTLTTKQAFAEVMPWFNTTVGLDDSNADFEAHFKNNSMGGNDDDLFAMEFYGEPDFSKVKNDPHEIYSFYDEDGENCPPIGYSQPMTNIRPIAGILQPSLNIPVQPLECVDDAKFRQEPEEFLPSSAPIRHDTLKEHCTDEEVTQFHGLDHSQFTVAARLASTPFGEHGDPRSLPTFHCSTIRPSGAEEIPASQPSTNENDQSSSANACTSPFNTPSKVLSPIFECSDEDAKTSSSSGASSQSLTNTKASMLSSHHNHSEATVVSVYGGDISRLERSLDITVHNAHGDILQIVNPFDPIVCRNLLTKLDVPVASYPGYHDMRQEVIPKFAAQKTVDLGDELYSVDKMVGTGAFGKVYSATCNNRSSVAIKIQAPANEWEFYVCSELIKRLRLQGRSEQDISMVVQLDDFYAFADGSCCVSNYHKKGTFLDLVNYYKKAKSLKEHIACYYTMEMMTLLECIHECGIIHGDIKPDNLLLIGNNDSAERRERGLALIDFGCSIDCTLFAAGTRFTVEKNTESFECIEMKTGKPWTTQVDTYGMLCSLHCLIFGDYMNVYKDGKTLRWKSNKIVDRSWNRDLWKKFFDVFLNIPSCDELPSIRSMLDEFKEYFDMKLKKRFLFHLKQQNLDFH